MAVPGVIARLRLSAQVRRPDMATDVLSSIQELAARTCDGLHVRLLWSVVESRAWVSVIDVKRDETVSVPIHDSENPLDVFHHPFAYAA
jgi:hypothetical protein